LAAAASEEDHAEACATDGADLTAIAGRGTSSNAAASNRSSGGGGGGGGNGGCIQQEVSFRYLSTPPAAPAYDDVVHSPTRYDQQQQEQRQLKGLLGSQEFNLSPPNPLFFTNSPLASPIGPSKTAAGFGGQQVPLTARPEPHRSLLDGHASIRHQPSAGATAAAPAGQHTPSVSSQVSAEAVAAAADQQFAFPSCAPPPQLQAVKFSNRRRAGGAGVHAAMQLRQPSSPDRQLAAPSIRAMPPGSPRRRCGLNTPSPPAPCMAAGVATGGLLAVEESWGVDCAPCNVAGLQNAATSKAPVYPAAVCDTAQVTPGRPAAGLGAVIPAAAVRCAASPGSVGSVGSSSSPANTRSKLHSRERVGALTRQQASIHHDQQQQQDQLSGSAAAGCTQTGGDALQKPLQLQPQQSVRQLFRDLECVQDCEVKAVASSGSYWHNLWAMSDEAGAELQLLQGEGQAGAPKHMAALPLVSGH
jgi:hypothetical protein